MDREHLMLECLKLANTNARDHILNIDIAKAYFRAVEAAGQAETPRQPKSKADSKS